MAPSGVPAGRKPRNKALLILGPVLGRRAPPLDLRLTTDGPLVTGAPMTGLSARTGVIQPPDRTNAGPRPFLVLKVRESPRPSLGQLQWQGQRSMPPP